MTMTTAAIFCEDPAMVERVYGAERLARLRRDCQLHPEIITRANFAGHDLRGVEVIFSTWGMFPLTESDLERLPALQVVFYAAGATDAFCRPLLTRGIQVVSAWRCNAVPVAEFTVAQITLGLKNYFALSRALTAPARWNQAAAGPGVYGSVVALIGDGAIAHQVQDRLRAYAVEVMLIPSRPAERTVSLEEAFRRAQVVSNHLPDRDDNAGVLNRALFASMPPQAVFINTGRGRQVDESGLIEVLSRRPDLTALLDVTWPEPPVADSPLYRLPNVFLSPHLAGSVRNETGRLADCVLDEFERWRRGEPLLHTVAEAMLLTSGQPR